MIKVVFWSQTGNTEAMAEAVVEGIKAAGKDAKAVSVSDISAKELSGEEVFALGCPAMGDEVLDEGEMEPFVEELIPSISGKKIALFGSYDWGDGEWMRSWEARMKEAGAVLVAEPVICNLKPDEEGLANCKALGEALAKA
ncbi:MAG: flavodoxin [Oribacterium parvum]|uniref:flavodoxin n=1 Tax=Oribacterium parvum TaxID=1501329 RepID=UPI001CAF5ED9|nr:flavodoxin [Oribacterium parvum]MBF1267916.1 flavodoxin [Oribacterium parvum]